MGQRFGLHRQRAIAKDPAHVWEACGARSDSCSLVPWTYTRASTIPQKMNAPLHLVHLQHLPLGHDCELTNTGPSSTLRSGILRDGDCSWKNFPSPPNHLCTDDSPIFVATACLTVTWTGHQASSLSLMRSTMPQEPGRL